VLEEIAEELDLLFRMAVMKTSFGHKCIGFFGRIGLIYILADFWLWGS